jgi:hypothetical protein
MEGNARPVYDEQGRKIASGTYLASIMKRTIVTHIKQ